ncbi:hypothetical protein TSMEX_010601 [Taenia solium]|eukprot:TsM_001192100 transcript=TsM_001192100 gene=TsM_001192100
MRQAGDLNRALRSRIRHEHLSLRLQGTSLHPSRPDVCLVDERCRRDGHPAKFGISVKMMGYRFIA